MDVFRIYCDNIIEGERFLFDILLDQRTNTEIIKEYGNPDVPIFVISIDGIEYQFNILTGIDWKRWNSNSLKELSESPDVFLTYFDGEIEVSLFGIEYCDAIKAGNQAWQRFTRSYELSYSGTHYFYITVPFKYERKKGDSSIISLRHGSVQVPLGHIMLTMINNTLSLEIYSESSILNKKEYKNLSNNDFLPHIVCDLIKNKEITKTSYSSISNVVKGMLEYIKIFGENNFYKDLLFSKVSKTKEKEVHQIVMEKFLYQSGVLFSKEEIRQQIITRDHRFKKIVKEKSTDEFSYTLFKKYLPSKSWVYSTGEDPNLTLIDNVKEFIDEISNEIHIDPQISKSLISQKYLVFIPIYGHKPEGEDSRPDRGVITLLKTLNMGLLEKDKTLVWFYSKGVPSSWNGFFKKPYRNQLWANIIQTAGYICVAKYKRIVKT